MHIEKLRLSNMRAIETAEFDFSPGFNLIVGVNGVGKTTALDALRICFSRVLPVVSETASRSTSFHADDMRVGRPYIEAVVGFTLGTNRCHYERRQWREQIAKDDDANLKELRRRILDGERPSDRVRSLLRKLATAQTVEDTDFFHPSESDLAAAQTTSPFAPLVIFYGVGRSVISRESPSRREGGVAAAYAEALLPRPMRVTHMAQWLSVQTALAAERPLSRRHLDAVVGVANRFLPALSDLRPANGNLLVRKDGVELDVAWLSEGERGTLAIAMDIARRLSLANPELEDPIKDAGAIVLIDEIDLHLHPRLQREVVHALVETFPACQFIATTHSPMVIGDTPPEHITLLTWGDGRVEASKPIASYGLTVDGVLMTLMGTVPRNEASIALVDSLEHALDRGELGEARQQLESLRRLVSTETAETAEYEAMLNNLEVLADADDSEDD